MKNFFYKNKALFKLLTVVAFAMFTYFNIDDYYNESYLSAKKRNLELASGIIGLMLTVMHTVEFVQLVKTKRNTRQPAGKN